MTELGQDEPLKKKVICGNCEKRISEKAVFCPKCGQKQANSKVRMRDFLWKLWMTTFHLDSRVLRTIAAAFVPGKLTMAYFAGKQKKYFHPVQFFFIALFFVVVANGYFNKNKTTNNFSIVKILAVEDGEKLKDRIAMRDSLEMYRDPIPVEWKTGNTALAFDSILRLYSTRQLVKDSDSLDVSLIPIQNAAGDSYMLAYKDIFSMQEDSLLQYYQVEPGIDQFCIRQVMRSGLHDKDLNRFWFGSISWSMLVLIGVMAAWLKLLYRRQRRYFVEHFVLLLHLQTGMLLTILSVFILKNTILPYKWIGFLLPIWLTVGYFITFKRYYQQGYLKTFLKWFIYQVLFLISFQLVLLGSMFAAVLLI